MSLYYRFINGQFVWLNSQSSEISRKEAKRIYRQKVKQVREVV